MDCLLPLFPGNPALSAMVAEGREAAAPSPPTTTTVTYLVPGFGIVADDQSGKTVLMPGSGILTMRE